uniref:Probable protein-export membrane protein SecG n=1 Tax=Calliarthron tuberculosum TaxID=48942 RepID=M4IV72_CALTB|nr:preprotein translocase subunit G [Calliarthron tuberculosum]AGA63857.1 preprotein translocase subunit G [Calliarthron tuberculosum]
MKLVWYLSSLVTIFLILFNNPKATSFGNLGNQSQLFSYTKSTQKNIQLITSISSLIFLLMTIILTSNFTK